MHFIILTAIVQNAYTIQNNSDFITVSREEMRFKLHSDIEQVLILM